MAGYVLIVESDPLLQRTIGDALREARYELGAETDLAWAKRSMTVRAPDAIVLDTKLTDGDGFSLAEAMRRDPETQKTPIFFVASRFRGAAHRAEARRRFAPAEYLPTPLDVNSLLALVLQAVPPSTARNSTPTPPRPGTPVPRQPGRPPPLPGSTTGVSKTGVALKDPAQVRERRDVERSAKTLAGERAELRGALKRTPFARLVQRLYSQRATGSLLLMRDSVKKIVSFVEGYPVSVRSNVLGECLGQILVGQKLISNDALNESVRRMGDEKRHQGEILVEMGVLSPYNLSRTLVDQMEAKLFEIFAWRDGQFIFKEGEPPPKETVRLERAPAALILEGIRRHYDAARQAQVLEPFAGRYVKLSADPKLRLQEMTSDAKELAFIRAIDGGVRMETFVGQAGIPSEKARLLLVALSEAGMIEPADSPTRRTRVQAPPVPQEQVTPPGSGPIAGGGPAALSPAQLATVAEALREQNFILALGLEANPSTADVDRAYETLARTAHPDRYRHRPDADRRLAQEVFEKLAEAHRVLRDPTRRRAHLARLEKQDRAKPERKTDTGIVIANPAARGLYEAGLEHLRSRRHHDAVEAFRSAARLVPGQAEFRAALGWALFREAPADARAARAALAELQRALQIDTRNRRARHYLAQLYAETGQLDLAIKELETILQYHPTAVEVAEELRRLRQPR